VSLPRLRRRVEPSTFDQWRAALPGLGLPEWVIGPGAAASCRPEPAGARGVTVPPMVAAALALQADPTVTVLFRVREPVAVTAGAVALQDGVLSALVRHRPADPDPAGDPGPDGDWVGRASEGWVEVALVPVERAASEVLRWLPARPDRGACLEVRVVRSGDAVASEVRRWIAPPGEGWRAELPLALAGTPSDAATGTPAADMREEVRRTLTACLADPAAGDLPAAGPALAVAG